MRAKPIFYLNGNERNFRDHYTISLRTGEPMPKKWQRYIELTPEEKARWDDSLKLDEEYRIAEAQGFPNGIPGGKMRGNILYSITQREEADGRNMQEDSFLRRPFIPQKTEIRRYNNIVPNNTPAYGRVNTPPTVTFNQKLNTESPNTGQNNILQMNTGIKKEPAFDVEKAVSEVASRFRALCEANDAQAKMNMQKKQEDSLMNGTMIADTSGNMAQTFGQNGTDGNQPTERTYNDVAKRIEQLPDVNGDSLSGGIELYRMLSPLAELVIKKMEEKKKTNPNDPRLTDYELYEIFLLYGMRYGQISEWHPTPEQEEAIRKQAEEMMKNSPMPKSFFAPHAVDSGVGIHLANSEYVAEHKEMKKYIPEESTVGQVITYDSNTWEDEACKALEEFIVTVNNIGDSIEDNVEIINWLCNKWSKNKYLNALGIATDKILRVWGGYQCFRNTYKIREEEIGRIMQTEKCNREEAEAKTRKYLPFWLTKEVIATGLGMYIEDRVMQRVFFPKDAKTILQEDYGI